MYSIVEISGFQYKIEKDKNLLVSKLEGKIGDEIIIDKVLVNNGSIGNPYIENSRVILKIVDHIKGDKIKIFKKKRRKGYQKLNGHRQDYTKVKIVSL